MTISDSYANFSAQFAPSLLGDLSGILLALFQIIVGGSCFFYIFQAKARGVGGGVIPGMRCVGLGLILGGIENLMGLGMVAGGGFLFWLILARRVVRQTSRGALLLGFVQGTGLQQGFVLYPKDPVPTRTLAHPQPNPLVVHSQSYDNNINVRPISFGLSDAIEHIPTSSPRAPGPSPLGQPDSIVSSPRPPLPKRLSSNFFANFSSRKSPTSDDGERHKPMKVKPGFTPFAPEDLAEGRKLRDRGWNRPGDRVTVQFPMAKNEDGSPAPVLHMRFSALDIPSPGQLMTALSMRTNTDDATDTPTHAISNGASNAARQGSHQDLEQGVGNVRRSSMLEMGIGGFARAVRTRVQSTFPQSVGSSRLSAWLGVGPRASTTSRIRASIQPEISQIQRSSQRHSLGLGGDDGGRWIPLTDEHQQHLYPDPRSLEIQPGESDIALGVAQPNAAHRPSQTSTFSYATTGISASDLGQTTPMAEIVQARTVQVSTQMSTLLYSPQMSGIVGAQILHDSPVLSQRRNLWADSPPGSSSGSPSPQKRMSEMLSASPTSGAAGASLPQVADGSRTAARARLRQSTMATVQSVETAYSNEEGDHLNHHRETLDVMGARVQARTPTLISNDTRRSVPLEHGWTPGGAAEQVVEEPDQSPGDQTVSAQSSVRVVQQEFLRYQQNLNQGTSVRFLGTEDGTTTCTIPPAYENHRNDQLAMNDRDVSPRLPPGARMRADSGVLGDPSP
ncbi:hypothetical protein FRB96_005954 [Tulasnella sp. 330]|nr:hypothetical protein FRB96_005954 [Tulasnella sp. 330]KAG8879673.1 hypothetical protein FRB97_001523 [Tulasnella sp. 331]KAG8888549.1 hypothetical protein FRB98_007414 [Tulasnella sp. 332]